MINLFKTALHNSVLLGPLIRLSQLDSRAIEEFLTNSTLGNKLSTGFQSFEKLTKSCCSAPILKAIFHPNIIFIGIALLFILSSFMGTSVIGLTTWGLFGFTLLAYLFTQRRVLKSLTLIDIVVLLFFMSIALSTAFSSYEITSLNGLLKMATFLIGYFAFRSFYAHHQSGFIPILWLLMLLGLGEAVIGYLQSTSQLQPLATWQDPNMNPELRITRIFGSLKPSNPNLLAGFLIPCFAAACGLKLYYLSQGRRWAFAIGICSISAFSILVALVMTGSRGGYLAIITMFSIIFMISGHLIFHQAELQTKRWLKKGWVLILALVLVSGITVFASSEKLQNRVSSVFSMRNDSSISYRLNVYQSTAEMFKDNWLVGIGPGNETFKQVYGLYMVPGYNALGAYSVPLEIAVEQGVIGLSIFLLLIGLLSMRVVLFMDSKVPLSDKIFVGLLYSGVMGSLAYGLFDTIWYRPSVNLLFWFMVAGLSYKTEAMFNRNKDNSNEALSIESA